ncbi:hypothetical protein [uncultured Flavobacterium sp.]|uniref:hypothetical protein n=1 Tax=uncultured Flavobacterium sp. TaxID=165435 RepID=UPI0030EF00C4|tara:strand:- start:1651 stop:2226 length:576 start_codon:yes stop_codon:yes gene_type:complete
MTTHYFTELSSKRSTQVIGLYYTNQERKPKYKKEFRNKMTDEKFVTNEVQIMKYKRNKKITMFFDTYSSYSKFSLIEVGFDFEVTNKASDVLRIVKRNIARLNQDFLGYIWLIDKGTENGTMHFHLVIACNKLDFVGKKLPKQMQFKFNEKKIHSSFVKNNEKLKQYLMKKKIYFIGKRKRVFGKSRRFIK